jgi:hypothetical protein
MSTETLSWRENNLPHPAAKGKHNFSVRACILSVIKEDITDENNRRIVAKFVDHKTKRAVSQWPWIQNQGEPVNLFDSTTKLGLHIAQTGRISIVYIDECIFKITKSRRWTRKKAPIKILALTLERVELSPSHLEALQGVIGKHL